MNLHPRLRLWAALAIILTLSLLVVIVDQGALPEFLYVLYDFPMGDKAGHFILMGLLGLGLNLLFPPQAAPLKQPFLLTGTKIALVVVTLEEFSQLAFAARSFSLLDLAFSCLGILSVEGFIRLRQKFYPT